MDKRDMFRIFITHSVIEVSAKSICDPDPGYLVKRLISISESKIAPWCYTDLEVDHFTSDFELVENLYHFLSLSIDRWFD